MPKLKVKDKYGVIPNSVLNNTELSFKAKGLYAYIQSKNDGWDFSAERISRQTKESVTSVRSGLIELETAGLLQRVKFQNDKGHWEIQYILHENPYLDIPTSENPMLENPTSENHTNISKKDISKKDISKKYINNNNKSETQKLKSWDQIKDEQGIMDFKDLIQEAINDTMFVERLCMQLGQEKKISVEIMKCYIYAIYSHWKHDIKVTHNNRSDLRRHLMNTIKKDIYGDNFFYKQALLIQKQKQNK